MKRTPLTRKTRLSRSSSMKGLTRKRMNAVSKKRSKSRVGKLGIVRLARKDMTELREQAYDRAQGICEMKLPGCKKYAGWLSGHLAHIRTKRNNGDRLDNVQWACDSCHGISHQYGPSGQKPCPPKERRV